MQKLTRKEFLELTAKGAIGVSAGVALAKLFEGKAHAETFSWPFPYQQLDVEHVRKLGHQVYWEGKGCCYGVFKAIVKALSEKIGEPYTSFPVEMMIFGHGGVAGWGTTCGALLGACAMINLVCDKATTDTLVTELLGWYTITNFPTDISNQYGKNGEFYTNKLQQELPQSKSYSPLCHASVSNWCNAAQKSVGSLERKERCARLTGDVAAKTVELLNAYFSNQFQPSWTTPATVQACLTCHGSTGINPVVLSQMECSKCHKPNWAHPATKVEQTSIVALNYKLSQNYPNPFNPTTTIEFSIPETNKVILTIYDVNGRTVRTLVNEELNPGTYKVVWDGLDDHGEPVASGVYFSRLVAGKFIATKKMILAK